MPDSQTNQNFAGHYDDWRAKRIATIIEWFGPRWFAGRSILEIGAGYGDIGEALRLLGANTWFSDGRPEHVTEMRRRKAGTPPERIFVLDAEQGIPADRHYDVILHLGVLYHLDNWRKSIEDASKVGRWMVLETEVCDSDDPAFELKNREGGYDQALSGTGSRPSAEMVEGVLRDCGLSFERLADARCNANRHVYDWPVTNTRTWRHGLRRWWWCGQQGVKP